MFRDEVKKLTKDIHKYVENLPVMKAIIASEITPQSYIDYMYQIHLIYEAIESNGCFAELGWNVKLADSYLNDIVNLENMFGIERSDCFGITNIYRKYLKDLDNLDSLSAHAYVRYMADLMGGSIINKKIPWSSTAYNIDRSAIKIISEYVNKKVDNKQLFISEVYNSFMSHAAILQMCS